MPGPVYYSIVEIPGDGVTTQHEFNFAGGYISRTHVKAQITDALGAITVITVTDGMFVGDFTLDIGVAPPVGSTLRIYRETPRDVPLADFTGGSRITEANLDTITRQAIFAVAEAFDVGEYANVTDLLAQAGVAAATATAAALGAQGAADNAQDAAELAAAAAVAAGAIGTDLANSADAAKGDALVAFRNTGGVARTLHNKFTDFCVTPQDFGAVGDGVADDTAAFNTALATGRPVYARATTGGYKITSTLYFDGGKVLFGDRGKTRFHVTAGVWFAELYGDRNSVSDILVDCTSGSGAPVFRLRNDIAAVNRCVIRDIETFGATQLIGDISGGVNLIVALNVENVIASLHRGAGVALTKAFAYLKMTHVTIDYVGSAAHNFIAYSIIGNQGAQLSFCDVTNGLVDATTSGAHGFAFQNCISVWMDNCMADTCGGAGFYLVGNCGYFYLTNCVASLCGLGGFVVGGIGGASLYGQLTNCVSSGRVGQAYAPASAHGFSMGGQAYSLANCLSTTNTGHGLDVPATGSNIVVSGGQYRDNGGRGIAVASGSVFLATGVLLAGNTAGHYSLASAAQHIAVSQNNGGSLITASGPATA